MRNILFLTMILLSLLSFSAGAENLLDNEYMRQAREYRDMAEKSLNEGDYEKSSEYAALAGEYLQKAEAEADRLARKYTAEHFLKKAMEGITSAEKSGVSAAGDSAATRMAITPGKTPVSYTHLRAHET